MVCRRQAALTKPERLGWNGRTGQGEQSRANAYSKARDPRTRLKRAALAERTAPAFAARCLPRTAAACTHTHAPRTPHRAHRLPYRAHCRPAVYTRRCRTTRQRRAVERANSKRQSAHGIPSPDSAYHGFGDNATLLPSSIHRRGAFAPSAGMVLVLSGEVFSLYSCAGVPGWRILEFAGCSCCLVDLLRGLDGWRFHGYCNLCVQRNAMRKAWYQRA